MKVSVILPTYNSNASLAQLLHCLRRSVCRDFEVIVIDDGGEEAAALPADLGFPCRLVRRAERKGPAAARNFGAGLATGRILLFIDSDVLVFPSTIGSVVAALSDGEHAVVNGMPATKIPSQDFFSNFYNLRLCYNYRCLPGRIETIYSSLFAIRRHEFLAHGGFSERFDRPTVEDSELGRRLADAGVKIRLAPEIPFVHQKKISLLRLLKNDWVKSVAKAELALRQLGAGRIGASPRLYSTPREHLLSVPFAYLALGGLLCSPLLPSLLAPALAAAVVFAWLNRGYLRFFRSERGWRFMVAGYGFFLVDLWLAGAGVVVGVYRAGRRA